MAENQPRLPPTPPPLPPPRLSRKPPGRHTDPLRPTPTQRAAACHDPLPQPFEPVHYFFYGTLMKPDILRGVLGLESDAATRPATLYGYELANWGQYRTLLDSASDATVVGCAYLVQSAEAAHKLAYYETDAYTLAACTIRFDGEPGGEPVQARTFKYAGDAGALRDGRFDRTLWERQMGQQLPQRSKP